MMAKKDPALSEPSPPEHLHVFVVCPTNSGSTLLVPLLSTSRNVSILPSEGQWVAWDLLEPEVGNP
jgi:hypothetical protein